ncbi:MAG: hypothetical protein LBP88_08460 [Treponema sp.]|jgi:hypothetical protein|nr:hypothetical protein [Treponema sp.]
MKLFTPAQEAIIRYLIAENEEQDEVSPLTPYLYALSGGLLPDMPFTLCRDKKAGLMLYVQDPGNQGEQLRRHCGELKQKLLDIADFIRYLAEQGYVRTIVKPPWEESPGIPEQWYGYDDFTPAETETLRFACSVYWIPRFTLYAYWEGSVLCSI